MRASASAVSFWTFSAVFAFLCELGASGTVHSERALFGAERTAWMKEAAAALAAEEREAVAAGLN